MSNDNHAAVVVTYNRVDLLLKALDALESQSRRPDHVFVIDNASTDDTVAKVTRLYQPANDWLTLVRLRENTGGAGGFAAGMQAAMDAGYSWIWVMDDDAAPHPAALAELMRIASNPHDIYGSLAVNGKETSWLMTLLGEQTVTTSTASDIPSQARVQMLPFLGFMIHRDLVAQIGLPDAGFFIAADDVEYCLRAQDVGAQVIVAGNSHIEHPKSRPYAIKLPGHTLTALALPPWKRYYDTRNRLLIARKYYGIKLWTQTVPGSFVRLLATLLKEPRKLAQLKAWCCGMLDGLLGIKGKRHEKWGIHL